MSTRTERVRELLRREISDIIRKEIKDPRIGFVTITDTEVTKDLRHAKIFISVMGDEKQKEETMAILNRTSGFIRGEFGRRAFMKVIPEISFRFDTGAEHGAHIFEVLKKMERHDDE